MTYKEFFEKYKEIYEKTDYSSFVNCYKDSHFIEYKWVIGDMAGGSCWSENSECPLYDKEIDKEPEMILLFLLIEKTCPNISFLTFKRLEHDCVKYREETDREYYGNYTIWAYNTVDMKQLYQWLKENGQL